MIENYLVLLVLISQVYEGGKSKQRSIQRNNCLTILCINKRRQMQNYIYPIPISEYSFSVMLFICTFPFILVANHTKKINGFSDGNFVLTGLKLILLIGNTILAM